MDDNWVFTEDNARHEFTGVATLASAARTLKDYRPEMADECLKAAEDIFIISSGKPMVSSRVAAAAELYLTTHNKKYLDDIIDFAKENHYVTTLLNRRRSLPEIKSSNKIVQAFGERLAMNTPIQGSAADIIKLAMVNVYDEIEKRNLKSRLILQVHDELILNVYRDELEEVEAIVKNKMENVVNFKVPLVVDINVGISWYEAK
jgi:hypothetical protein